MDYALSKMSIIDLLTIIPVFIELILFDLNLNLNFFRILRILRIVRILRMFRALKDDNEDHDFKDLRLAVDTSGINKQIMILIMTIFSVLFIGAGIANALNTIDDNAFHAKGDFNFLTAFYYTIVTTATLGYGDIYPLQTTSRMMVVVMILTMVYILSDQLTKMSQLMSNYSRYDTRYHVIDHIIITGYYTPSSLSQFLSQFYHPDHGKISQNCIIIGANYPNSDILKLINSLRYEDKIKYLEGDLTSQGTLEKANAYMADSIFILTNQHSSDLEANDINAVMITKMVQHYYPYTQTFLQLVKNLPSSLTRYVPWHTTISVHEMKMSILGLSVYNQCFSTMMTSLYTSSNTMVPNGLEVS